jgi:toxin secretion/phage lysis holin
MLSFSYGKIVNFGLGGFLSAIAYVYGGWSVPFEVLLVFMVIDFVTGWMAGAKEGKLKSKVSFIGIARKVFVLCMVAVGHMLDRLFESDNLVRDTIIYFYILNELLSITENAGRFGFKIPIIVTQMIEILKQKSGENDKK